MQFQLWLQPDLVGPTVWTRAQARAPQESMAIGIYGHTDPREVARLDGMLLMPELEGEIGGYAINRRQWVENHE